MGVQYAKTYAGDTGEKSVKIHRHQLILKAFPDAIPRKRCILESPDLIVAQQSVIPDNHWPRQMVLILILH